MLRHYSTRTFRPLIYVLLGLALVCFLTRATVFGQGPLDETQRYQIYLPLVMASQGGGEVIQPPVTPMTHSTLDFLSLANAGSYTVGTVTGVQNEDILSFDGVNFALVFEGSDVGLGALNLDAFYIVDANTILMSFDSPATLSGLGPVDDADIVRFAATSLGPATTGTFSMFFDGSQVGLEASLNSEDIDAIELLPDGRLLISTVGNVSVPGVSGQDEDLLAFTPASPGVYTTGSWAMYFDGSDVKLNTSADEDVDGAAVSPDGAIYLTTLGNFSVTGISGANEDVFTCTPTSLGNNTACTFAPTLFFDGSGWGLAGNNIDAIDLLSNPAAGLVWKPYLQQLTATSVIVLWTTRAGTNPVVRYSPDTSYSAVASGSTRTLNALGTRLHRVELTGLQPDTPYHYKIYTEGADLLPNEVLSFRTAPGTGSATPFTFIAFGDYGQNSDSQKRLRDQMLLDSFSFIFTTGDNAYGKGTYNQFDAKVFQIYRDIFSRAAIFPTLGNHDYQTGAGAPYLDLFDLPGNAWRTSDRERYYSFDYGNVHFVALDSNTPLDADDNTANDDMFDWLRHDLSQTTQPWKIVAFHHPAYSTGIHSSDSRVQSRLVPIFEQYGVDLVLTGHDHTYQRTKPLRGGQVTTIAEGGIVYIVSGAGDAVSYFCGPANWLAAAYCSGGYGLYTRITVNGNSLTIETIDDSGLIKDSYTIP